MILLVLIFFIFPIFLSVGVAAGEKRGYFVTGKPKDFVEIVRVSTKVWKDIFEKADEGFSKEIHKTPAGTSISLKEVPVRESKPNLERKAEIAKREAQIAASIKSGEKIHYKKENSTKLLMESFSHPVNLGADDILSEYRNSYRGSLKPGEVILNGKKIRTKEYR